MWWKGGLGLLAIIGLLVLLWPQQRSNQEQIQESLYNIVRGVADKDSRQVLTEISDQYIDQTGWKKNNIRGILFQQFQQRESFSLQISPSTFEINPPKAEVTAKVVVFGGSMWNPNTETQVFRVSFFYEQEEDVWKLQGHSREYWEE